MQDVQVNIPAGTQSFAWFLHVVITEELNKECSEKCYFYWPLHFKKNMVN